MEVDGVITCWGSLFLLMWLLLLLTAFLLAKKTNVVDQPEVKVAFCLEVCVSRSVSSCLSWQEESV